MERYRAAVARLWLAAGCVALIALAPRAGMTQQQAHAALLRFLHRAQADGVKTALVVTGKGLRKSSGSAERDADYKPGVLKRQVPMWLALPEFRLLVVGFDDAHVGHGGAGALYVRLRRGN